MTEQTCPRRMLEPGPWDRAPLLDGWETGHGLVGRQEQEEKSCSFCGSLHPDTFMEWVKQGGAVHPTDKNYKAYIDYPGVDPRKGETTERIEVTRNGRGMHVTTVYGTQAKFYFQHLSEAQRIEFVDLYNNGTMKVLGNAFYQLPYFMRRKP